MSSLWSPPHVQLFDSDADAPQALAGAKLYFYNPGTDNTRTVYQDATLATPHSQPVVANAAGRFSPIYLPTGSYKVVLKDASDVTIWTADQVPGPPTAVEALTTAVPLTRSKSKVGDYTILAADAGYLIHCNCTSATFTITLLSAVTAGEGFRICIRHEGTANQVKILTTAGQTISRPNTGVTSSSMALVGYGESYWFVSDGANWKVDSYTPPLIPATTGVIRIEDRITAAPGSPVTGGRYLVTAGFGGFSTNAIIEYTGQTSTFIAITPPTDCGWLAYVVDEDATYQFQGSAWGRLWYGFDNAPKAWAKWENSGSALLTKSQGVSSISRSAEGIMGVFLMTQMDSDDYSVPASPASDLTGSRAISHTVSSFGTGGFSVYSFIANATNNTTLAAIDLHMSIAVIGKI